METKQNSVDRSAPETIALQALTWTLADQDRAQRLLALTGLDPHSLRDGLEDPAMLAALIQHIANHEQDLISCADAIGKSPEVLVQSAAALGANA